MTARQAFRELLRESPHAARREIDAALKEVAAAEWEMQAMRDDDHHPDFETCWLPMRHSLVSAAITLARALRRCYRSNET